MTVQILPSSLAPVVEAIGSSATISLVRVYGGTRLYIPTTVHLGDSHPLCALLGRPLAEKLCRALGGEYLVVPRVHRIEGRERDRVIVERATAGDSYAAIARDLHITERAVHGVVAKARAEA